MQPKRTAKIATLKIMVKKNDPVHHHFIYLFYQPRIRLIADRRGLARCSSRDAAARQLRRLHIDRAHHRRDHCLLPDRQIGIPIRHSKSWFTGLCHHHRILDRIRRIARLYLTTTQRHPARAQRQRAGSTTICPSLIITPFDAVEPKSNPIVYTLSTSLIIN